MKLSKRTYIELLPLLYEAYNEKRMNDIDIKLHSFCESLIMPFDEYDIMKLRQIRERKRFLEID